MTGAAARHRALAEPSRLRLLEVLDGARAPLGVAELAGRTGLHANTVRDHLAVLERAGLVASRPQARGGPGRPRLVFESLQRTLEHEHALLAAVLAGSLEPHPDGLELAIESGRSWGRRLVRPFAHEEAPTEAACVGRVVGLLAERGFSPELSGRELRMHRCPFRELADTYPRIVCALHQGLVDGALDELGAPVRVESLERGREPAPCVARLAARAGATPGGGARGAQGTSSSGTVTTWSREPSFAEDS